MSHGMKKDLKRKRRKPRRRALTDAEHFARRAAARKRSITKALRDLASDHANLAKQAAALEAITDLMAPTMRALWDHPAIRGAE